ncbi:MAG TPA: TonB-dependent receptor [Bacteroides sp.]|nr:TonB-dependent receptor [Bacteroides sp.]
MLYSATDKLKIKILFGRAYLAPSPYRQYQHYGSFRPTTDSITGGINGLTSDFWRLPAEELESQKISTYETGISYIIKSNLIFAINGYINDVDDIISSESYSGQEFKGIPVAIIERPVNKGRAYSYGGTAKLDFKKSWSTLTLNSFLAYSYADGEIDGQQIPYTAQNTIKAAIDLNFKRLSTSTRFIYRSESYHRNIKDQAGNRISSDPYGIINLSARYLFVDRDRFETDFFVKINNLLNSRYYNVPVGGAESIKMAPQDPIRILLGLQFYFL